MYTAQRWTGGIAFAYIVWHTYTMRFTGVDLHEDPMASFGKVQGEVMHTALFLFYVAGLVAASWHFAYGIWLFCAKWGIVSGDKAQKRLLRVCLALFLVLCAAGFASLYSFRSRPMKEIGNSGSVVDARHGRPSTTSSGKPSDGRPVQ